MPKMDTVTPGLRCLVTRVLKLVQLGSPNARRGHRNAGTAVRKHTGNTHPALPSTGTPSGPLNLPLAVLPPLVFTLTLAVFSPDRLAERPMRRPIAPWFQRYRYVPTFVRPFHLGTRGCYDHVPWFDTPFSKATGHCRAVLVLLTEEKGKGTGKGRGG